MICVDDIERAMDHCEHKAGSFDAVSFMECFPGSNLAFASANCDNIVYGFDMADGDRLIVSVVDGGYAEVVI